MERSIKNILLEVDDKRDARSTTSHKFKQELLEFFNGMDLTNCIEVGTASGHTTRILSYLFDRVITIEQNDAEIQKARTLNKDRTNIEYLQGDAYNTDWGIDGTFDIAFIDCVHQYDFVKSDFDRCKKLGAKYFVFDDYGLNEVRPSVKVFVDEMVSNGTLEIVKFIGEPAGTKLWEKYNRQDALVDWEGVIIKL